jgi:hypothetical protein
MQEISLFQAQIYGLYEEVESLRKLKLDREQQYSRLRHTNITDNLAEVQVNKFRLL